MQTPTTEAEWQKIAEDFEQKWNFPNCVGAVDGKHVVMNAPPNSGSIYFNYKHTHSVVLMAICDANYKFLYIDAGCNGRISDGGVFNKCTFAAALDNGALHMPEPRTLPGTDVKFPYVIVADDAFALKMNIMKPFPGRNLTPSQRIFNYRLSRARRIIENAFGIMSAKFRVLLSQILLDAAKTRKVILACCALHNFSIALKDNEGDGENANNSISDQNEQPEDTLYPLESDAVNETCENAKKVREEFEKYFMSDAGAVSWQSQYV